MGLAWGEEYESVALFAHDLEARPPLPQASSEDLAAHAAQVAKLQDLLALIATLPAERRPPVGPWDDILGHLWRRLYAKGDDVTRYILADLWAKVLLEAGERDRYYRTATAVAASARNFYRFDEAAEICRQVRKVSDGRPSAALANLINTEGAVYLFTRDFDAAERTYGEALSMEEALDEEELRTWTGLSREDFRAQERLNLLEVHLRRGEAETGAGRGREALRSRNLFDELARSPFSSGFRHLLDMALGELLLLEGRLAEAKALLQAKVDEARMEGPYSLSLGVMAGRLLSQASSLEGDWAGAYRWIRWAIKEGTAHAYPAENQFVLDQAVRVLKSLHDSRDMKSESQLVRDFSFLLEDKDWYTGRSHSHGVARLAVRLGEALNAQWGWHLDVDLLGRAGLLHDIGKLRVPWSLLNKIAPITPKEWVLLRAHCRHGADLLNDMGMREVGEVVLQHHEALDGSGYPNGRPPAPTASVVAVCDVHEAAVTPNRRYKHPRTPREALGEIQREAGRLYHPDVVAALASLSAGRAPG